MNRTRPVAKFFRPWYREPVKHYSRWSLVAAIFVLVLALGIASPV